MSVRIIGITVVVAAMIWALNGRELFVEIGNKILDTTQTMQPDSLEYSPQWPNTKITALDQLKEFPLPRYKSGNQLMRNFLWIDPMYLGGLSQPGYQLKNCVQNSLLLQAELSNYWNYYFNVSVNTKAYYSYKDTNSFPGVWMRYANQHPEIPVAAITFWSQVRPEQLKQECNSKVAMIFSSTFNDTCYISDKDGKLISYKHRSPLVPYSLMSCDGRTQKMYIDSLLANLKRPLDFINENGEVFIVYPEKFIAEDKNIVRDKNKYPDLSWNQYQTVKRLEKEMAYKNAFMQNPLLKNTVYSEYAIDGEKNFRHDYALMRKINSKINGMYYSTPDFYPRFPDNWKKWRGPWHGLEWIENCRNTEIALGDKLFSPFVAAGWNANEEKNIRPGQWLGLLKILGVMGAEFYYSGFFNTAKDLAKPENYVWQCAMPAYAQAITSYYEDILRNGILLNEPNYILYPESDVPVVVRKHQLKKIYVIGAALQTNSNYKGAVADSVKVTIEIEGKKIGFIARRQGSVYILNLEKTLPTIVQLDSWHQWYHPYYWSKDITIEAELGNAEIITEKNINLDFSNSISYADIKGTYSYSFACAKEKKLTQLLLKLKDKNQIKLLTVELNGKILVQENLPKKNTKDNQWATFLIPESTVIKGNVNQIIIRSSGNTWLDKIKLTE